MRKLPFVSGAVIAVALAVSACGGTAAPTVPAVVVPSIAIPSIPAIVVPTLPVGVPTLPSGSFVLPSFAIPSFAGDPTLAAKFPTTVGGKPVSTPQTALYGSLFQFTGGTYEAQQFAAAMTSIGVDPNTVSYGAATVELSETTNITAIRTPNYSAAQFLAALPQLTAIFSPDEPAPVIGQVSIAGKTITTATDADETTTYYYASGDTIWTTSASDPADLTAVFTAIQ